MDVIPINILEELVAGKHPFQIHDENIFFFAIVNKIIAIRSFSSEGVQVS